MITVYRSVRSTWRELSKIKRTAFFISGTRHFVIHRRSATLSICCMCSRSSLQHSMHLLHSLSAVFLKIAHRKKTQ